MAFRNIVPLVASVMILSSSSLFAADATALNVPASALEISSTTTTQPRPEASCELKVRERYEYYNIDGSNVNELQKQMKDNGTKWGDGRTYAALTTWDLNFSYDISEENGKCSVKSVKTDVEIVYHFPRRIPTGHGTLAPLWDSYMTHLKTHEYGHKDIAVKSAGEINEVLASLQNCSSQEELEKEAKRLTDEKLQQLKELQIAYDAETHHGETQGAVLAAE